MKTLLEKDEDQRSTWKTIEPQKDAPVKRKHPVKEESPSQRRKALLKSPSQRESAKDKEERNQSKNRIILLPSAKNNIILLSMSIYK